MHKVYQILGSLLIGLSVVGLFSFTAAAFPAMRAYSYWLTIAIGILLIVAALADDYIIQVAEINQQQYIGMLIVVVGVLLVGGLIQWAY